MIEEDNKMFEEIKKQAYEANMQLYRSGLAPFTFGNASAVDREAQVFAIKPSGVPFEELTPEKMVVVSFEGKKVDGELNPSSDTVTHAMIYRKFLSIGGIVHTHSVNAVSFAQAGYPIPAFGTTHADYAFGEIPCTRKLTEEETAHDYEFNTGRVITEHFRNNKIDENSVPAVLVKSHGPFVWGKTAAEAASNAQMLEMIADMAIKTLFIQNLARKNDRSAIDGYLLKKHYERKHGDGAYYGQDED